MNQPQVTSPRLNNIQRNALIVGVVGLVLSAIGAFISTEQFFQSYLLGFVFWLQLALGGFAMVMLHHLVGGRWGFTIRRLLESSAMTLPLMALLFIPLLFGLQVLYTWARPEAVADSHLLQHKEPWLNVPFFIGRAVFYFVVWVGLAYLLNKWSLEQDRTADPKINNRLKSLSAAGIILYMLTATFAAFDWMMSLEPKWFSSIYGVIYIAGQAVITVASSIIIGSYLANRESMSKWFSIDIFNDLGNFLLAFVSFWAYVSFSQYLILWSANLPETVTWYVSRTQGGWQWLAIILIFFHFALPFAILLSRTVKRRVQILFLLSIFIILMRFVDLFWIIMPAFHAEGFSFHWLNIVAPLGIGGVWVAFFIRQLKGKSLIPLHDPRFQEVPAHE